MHAMGAAFMNTPELMLDASEAQSLAIAIGAVQAHYPVNIDPKAIAWTNLIMVAGAIYGTRAVAIYARKKMEKENSAHVIGPTETPRGNNGAPFNPMTVQAGPLPN